jgi:ribonuclease HI
MAAAATANPAQSARRRSSSRSAKAAGAQNTASRNPPPTNQCAELTAVILALTNALEQYDKMLTYPRVDVTIHVDSKYAIGCMTEWIHRDENWRADRLCNENMNQQPIYL